MSEFEISLLRQRALEAHRQKVRRGKVLTLVPVGYVRTEDDGMEITPDRQVQEAVRGIFQKFRELGSIRQVLLWYRNEKLMIPTLGEESGRRVGNPPQIFLKLHWAGGVHTELVLRKNQTGHHNRVNSREVIDLVRELAQVCDDSAMVGILNRLGYRTGNENTWNEKRLQHVRHSNGIPACPPPEQRNWVTMSQAAVHFRVSLMVVRRMIAQKILPARQVVKCAPWMIERAHLELPAVRKEIRRVHEGRRPAWVVSKEQTGLFTDSDELQA